MGDNEAACNNILISIQVLIEDAKSRQIYKIKGALSLSYMQVA